MYEAGRGIHDTVALEGVEERPWEETTSTNFAFRSISVAR
jgi:hypothetical protein